VPSRSEQDVVISVAVERRVEVDEINGFVLDMPSQHVEVVSSPARGSVDGCIPVTINSF